MRFILPLMLLAIAAISIAAPAHASVSVTDDTGAIVTLAEPAKRIVSLAPHVTEMLYAAGAGGKIVGAVGYSDFPDEAKRVPRVGSYSAFDFERIVRLKPDLVVGWASGNPAPEIQRLRALGMTLYLSEPHRLDDIASDIVRLGALSGSAEAASRAAQAFRDRRAALERRYGTRPAVSVFYEIWNQPLMTVNGEHVISDVISLCGGRNVFARLKLLAAVIDVESVLQADPDVIVASGMDAARPEWLDEWRRWPRLRAVQGGRLYFIPPDLIQRHTPRILEGAEQMCRALEQARVAGGKAR